MNDKLKRLFAEMRILLSTKINVNYLLFRLATVFQETITPFFSVQSEMLESLYFPGGTIRFVIEECFICKR